MAQEILISISFIVVISSILAIIAKIIKQPPIIAYLAAGVLVGPLFFNLIGPSSSSSELMQTFAHIGVAFLLFIVGLNLDFRLLKEIGKVSIIGGIIQVTLTVLIGFIVIKAFNLSLLSSIYISLALAFSSTVVAVKILSDKKEIDTLHGRIALGILIVQDFIAAAVLTSIPLLTSQKGLSFIVNRFLLGLLVIGLVFFCALFFFKKILNYLARNQEVLFLTGIAWALALSTTFDLLGFSLEIGALIAGMSLASTRYTLELEGKIKPLRDFFVVLFFVFFGSQLAGDITLRLIIIALILSIFVVIGKPIIVMSLLRLSGYKKRTNFLTGTSLAHISEFSLILALLGFNLGHLNQEIMSLLVLVSIITIGVSSYGIYYAHTIFKKISHLLNIFEGKKEEIPNEKKENYEVLLFGYHRLGYKILQTLKKLNVSFAVIDYNPKVVLTLGEQGNNAIYGDAADKDFLSQIDLTKTKLIISTIPDESSNFTIKEKLKEVKSNATFIATAEQPRQALDLYSEGVDYVIVPHHLGGDLMSSIIKAYKTDKSKYRSLGENHKKELRKARNNSKF